MVERSVLDMEENYTLEILGLEDSLKFVELLLINQGKDLNPN